MEKVVIISGFAGSGKSTLAKRIAEEFRLEYVSASAFLKELSHKSIEDIKNGQLKKQDDWWESKEGEEYLKTREKNMSMDKELDEELLKRIEKGNIVLDSKTMGYLSDKGFRVWLHCSPEKRAERVCKRDCMDKEEVLRKILERDEVDARIYRKLHGFELGKELKKFDLVLDTDNLNEVQVQEKVIKRLKEEWKA